jgi:hypothetical protein
VDFVPTSILLPGAEVVEHDAVGRQVVGQGAPNAAIASLVEDGVDHLAAWIASGPSSGLGLGDVRLDQLPLSVAQVGWVVCPVHTRRLPDLPLLDKLSS